MTIADREGITVVSRSFVYEGATIRTGKDLKSKTRWDHGILKATTTQSGATTFESYALSPDGAMTVSVVRPERKPITLVFQRKRSD